MSEPETIPDPFHLCGTTIEGKYRVASVVGDGGFGVVYRAVHAGFGELIAVKCLKLPHALDQEQREGFLEQLREEGRLLHRLSKATPGIVQALDVGALTTPLGAWVPYLVLEWLDGETLADHLAARFEGGQGPYPLEEAIRLIEPAARALAVAHAMKVAHRDVKPANLFVTHIGADGASTLKVLDFGIAKVLTTYPTFTEALAATKAGPAAFTPRYGAPEQFNKQRGASGPWTDVFALGLILVELLTGRKALEGDDPTQLYVAAADPSMRPTPNARGAGIPPAVEAVFEKALAIEPKNRYADAGEMLDALLQAAGLAPALARPKPASPRARKEMEATVPAVPALLASPVSSSAQPTLVKEVATQKAADGPPGRHASVSGTVQVPGVGPKPPADPMSETPFFERHHLPASRTSVGQAGTPAPAPAPPLKEAARPQSIWPLLGGVLVLGGAAGAYAFWGTGEAPHSPARPRSSVTFKTPILPTGAAAKAHHTPPVASTAPAASAATSAATNGEPAASTVDMIYVAPGALTEGDAGRKVTVARGFYIDRTEVTARAYAACVAKRMCSAADRVTLPPGDLGRWGPTADPDADAAALAAAYTEIFSLKCNAPRGAGDHPINCVDFASAEAFCKWSGKRLPTEAEWALAAGGPEGRAYPWGADPPSCGRSCYDKNEGCRDPGASIETCASGEHPADRTPDGIYDLGGNVAEWVSDAAGDKRIVRGGSFIDGVDMIRVSTRSVVPPALAHAGIGFRCALDAKAGAEDGGAR